MQNPYQTSRFKQPGRSVFNLSYEKKFTCDMGQLIPIMCDEVVPGDIFSIGNEIVVRFQPLVAPVLHEINVYVHYFYVPYRILWDDWEDFITGGEDGLDDSVIPVWDVTFNTVGSLWDYLGFPLGIDVAGAQPMNFPRYAYNEIYNAYYRDENLITKIVNTNEAILRRAWEKDYFTSSMPFQQRGTAPALPISGTSEAVWNATAFADGEPPGSKNAVNVEATNVDDFNFYTAQTRGGLNLKGALEDNEVDLSSATTFDVADLRLVFQIQKWLEANARGGARYTEFLKHHFGVSPTDERLNRPEYIGGSKSPVIVSEVLQTSETGTSPQGTLAGHGLTASRNFCAKYRVKEFGLIMGIMSIMPRTAYHQGINRQWLRETKYDFYFPEFAHLSEQPVLEREVYASGVEAQNETVFGYQGRYNEMRAKRSMVCGEMHATFDYWHLCRQFGARPVLNKEFVECVPRKDIFASPEENGLIVNIANIIKAVRPMPISADPGMMGH
ncbi:hypothetical protein ES705_27821 [subsurface metagenome]